MPGLEAEYTGQVRFVYLDIDDPATTPFKQALGHRYQPHIFVIDAAGEIAAQWVGPVTAQEVRPALDQVAQWQRKETRRPLTVGGLS